MEENVHVDWKWLKNVVGSNYIIFFRCLLSIDNALLLHFIRKETVEKEFIWTMARSKEIAGYGSLYDDDRGTFLSHSWTL